MRDQYAGDLSDVLKFALLRTLAGDDRMLGVAWYYVPGDDGRSDGRHVEWLDEPAWRTLDQELYAELAALRERSVAALEAMTIWPKAITFHRKPVPPYGRAAWAAETRQVLDGADIVFLDPDNGVGSESEKHATFLEIQLLRRPGRAVAFITFPSRGRKHDDLLQLLHQRLAAETQAANIMTLRTNVSVPRTSGSPYYVQRQRWFTIVDADDELVARATTFAAALASVPRVRARLDLTRNLLHNPTTLGV